MKRFLSLFLAMSLALTFSLEASAKRLGSGSSMGSKPMHQTQSRQTADNNAVGSNPAAATSTAQRPATAAQPATAAAQKPSGASRWLGPLAGLAAGGLLASMFMGDGFEGIQFFDILLMAAIGFGIFFLIRRLMASRQQPGYQAAGAGLGSIGSPQAYAEPKIQPLKPGKEQPLGGSNIFGQPIDDIGNVRVAQPQQASQLDDVMDMRTYDAPAWFDEQRFLQIAREHFMALQQHWDSGEMDKLAEFFTPQMMEFLHKERAALGDGFQSTYIENLEVYLDGIEQQDGSTIATLTFEGVAKTSRFDQGEAFSESWRMERRDGDNQPWMVAGIRQN